LAIPLGHTTSITMGHTTSITQLCLIIVLIYNRLLLYRIFLYRYSELEFKVYQSRMSECHYNHHN